MMIGALDRSQLNCAGSVRRLKARLSGRESHCARLQPAYTQPMRAACLLALLLLPAATAAGQPATRMLPIGTDTFVSRFKGAPDGTQVHSLVETNFGYKYTESWSFPSVLTMTFVVEFDSSLNVLRSRSFGYVGRRRMASDIEYQGQRATGRATSISSPTGAAVPIDTVLPPGAFDGSALYVMLFSQPWTVGKSATLTLFDTDELNITKQSFRVVAREEIQLPAGKRMALRADLTTTQQPVTIWFSEARPHRLLKVASATGETVRINGRP